MPSWHLSRLFATSATDGAGALLMLTCAVPAFGQESGSSSTLSMRLRSLWIEDWVCRSCPTGRRRGQKAYRSRNCRFPTAPSRGASASSGPELRFVFDWSRPFSKTHQRHFREHKRSRRNVSVPSRAHGDTGGHHCLSFPSCVNQDRLGRLGLRRSLLGFRAIPQTANIPAGPVVIIGMSNQVRLRVWERTHELLRRNHRSRPRYRCVAPLAVQGRNPDREPFAGGRSDPIR